MPLHVPALSRRQFLVASTAALTSLSVSPSSWGAEAADPHSWALLSDTHIPTGPDVIARDVNMTANLKQVVRELCALKQKPAGVLINGDCAYLKGLPDDYANLAGLVQPLAEAGLPLHLTMGNHDDRDNLYAALNTQRPTSPVVDSRHISLIELPHVNLFLLDTLKQVNLVTGELGADQLTWLEHALNARREKPAVVIAHHTPQFTAPEEGKVWTGIADTEQFFALLTRQKQVKAFIFGHSHDWSINQKDGLHLINLPPVAYVFGANKPNGWVSARFRTDGIDLKLHTIDPAHQQNGEQAKVNWS